MKVLTREFEVEFEDIDKITKESFKNTKKFIVEFEQTKDFTKKFAKKIFTDNQIGLYMNQDVYVDIFNEKVIKKDRKDIILKISNSILFDFYDAITDDNNNLLLSKYQIKIVCDTNYVDRTTTEQPIKCKISLNNISSYQCYIDFKKNKVNYLNKDKKNKKQTKTNKTAFEQSYSFIINFKDILKNPYIQQTSFDKYYELLKENYTLSSIRICMLIDYLLY